MRPQTPDEAVAALRECVTAKVPVRPVGTGSRADWGGPDPRETTAIETAGLDRVVAHDVGDFTAVLQAGVPLARAQAEFAHSGQWLAVDPPPHPSAGAGTIGGLVATADSGPCRHRYGGVRDLVIGLTVALSDGTLARSGGKVIKNVAGYDLAKLLTGSYGTLGLIVEVVVRLHPVPPTTATVVAEDADAARDLANIAAACTANLEVWDLTDVPVEVCIERDAARGSRIVGERVIRDLHRRYLAGRRYPLPMPVPDPAAMARAPVLLYAPPTDAPTAVMVDIDGTVALMGNRSPYDESQVHLDQPNLAVIMAIRALHAAGHAVVFCSGRTEACRADTEAWLATHVGVAHSGLFLRPIGDRRRDSVVKREIFDRHIRTAWHVVAVFDDRQQVVDAWRELGLTVFQVAPGDF